MLCVWGEALPGSRGLVFLLAGLLFQVGFQGELPGWAELLVVLQPGVATS